MEDSGQQDQSVKIDMLSTKKVSGKLSVPHRSLMSMLLLQPTLE